VNASPLKAIDAMSGSLSPRNVVIKTPTHASDKDRSEYVSVEVNAVDMVFQWCLGATHVNEVTVTTPRCFRGDDSKQYYRGKA
jgi:hypothetical protein